MNLFEIRRRCVKIMREWQQRDLDDFRDEYIEDAWNRLAEQFVIPELTRTVTLDAVADQQAYLLPYDFNDAEIALKYGNRRLDPLHNETVRLKYERRTGNMGRVRYYTMQGVIGEELFHVDNCRLTNGSAVVQCTSTDTRLNVGWWVRFDPYTDSTENDADPEGWLNPGDYGYQINAGQQAAGTSFELTTPYRGPSGAAFTCRVRPPEQKQFWTWGIPATSETGVFELTYSSRPRRLYDDAHVPESPQMGPAIAYLAVSLMAEWYRDFDLSKTYWQRSMQRAEARHKRRRRSQILNSDIPIGGAVGRRVGMQGVWTGQSWTRYR